MAYNIVTVIQARMGSTRLPGKVLKPLAGKAGLVRMVERVRAARNAGTVVVAITEENGDDVLAELCCAEGIPCFRGSTHDVLDRHYRAGLLYKADAVVKIPSDCPLIDPAIIETVLDYFLENRGLYDYVSNLHPPTWPDGNDVEVMPMPLLEQAWREAGKAFEREHTSPWFWEQPERFRIGNVCWGNCLDYSMTHRFTLDYEADYRFIARIYDELYEQNPLFGLQSILELLERKPAIMALNQEYAGVNWYGKHLHELKTIRPEQTVVRT